MEFSSNSMDFVAVPWHSHGQAMVLPWPIHGAPWNGHGLAMELGFIKIINFIYAI